MGDHIFRAIRIDGHFAHGKLFAELEQTRLSNQVAWGRLSQKIDRQVRGNREGYPADGGQDREIHREIAKGHHCGAGKRAAWPQGALVVALTQAAAAPPQPLDLIIPYGMAGIREFDAKPVEKLLARQRRRSHLNRSGELRVRPFHIRHGTCMPPRVSIQ